MCAYTHRRSKSECWVSLLDFIRLNILHHPQVPVMQAAENWDLQTFAGQALLVWDTLTNPFKDLLW